ncbi:Methyltransferase domain-containing protein [Yoonia tamlensis]|uniref:Methyltransferase domain-containing protein n=1 Tax=Yoonia tamlensis TaxID=390270 RepID=A0A1I6GXC1_9RHOB|nr:class I SAM-dependent methyltransferase [Yoonia tamlensis]SFR46828.1 Methyltransferase domain-containing protein [Yoonia tamlensis]
MTHNYFDSDVAGSYDQLHGQGDIAGTVDTLAELADNGPILEFAIGTGRIALPLAARGFKVKGIELSGAMVDELRKKEVGTPMEIAIGDMCTTRVAGEFSLVCLVFNTIDNLTNQDAQVACFENAAAHLADGGRFVIETLVPPIQKIPFGETQRAFACDETHLGIDSFDITTQRYSSTHVWMDQGQHSYLSVPFRYTWPAELDLMARIAGLTLEHRWADWAKSPFTNQSTSHVSVWRKAP